MKVQYPSKSVKVQPRKAEPHPSAPAWKPHQVGLTRQELRDIIIDLIG